MARLKRTKRTSIISPVVVAIDTREQLPYAFAGFRADARQGRLPLVVRTVTQTLATGDYSLVGFEARVAIERKSIEDLYGTLGQGRERFERELERLAVMDVAAVVIEAPWAEILLEPPPGRRLLPKTIHRSVIAWQQRYPRVHWWACTNRELAERTTFRILERFLTEQERAERLAKKERRAEAGRAEAERAELERLAMDTHRMESAGPTPAAGE